MSLEYVPFLLTILTMLSSTDYLEATLLPLIESIKPKTTESFILEACGLGSRPSTQSVSITIGSRLEKFWNTVISDLDDDVSRNLIEDSDRVDVNGRTRQIDHFFTIPDLMYASHMYLESKCNVNFDTEKIRASNEKIHQIAEVLGEKYNTEVQRGYFIPVKREIPVEISREYVALGVGVYGVSDLFRWVGEDNMPFTIDEYFDFFKTRLAPVIENLLDGVPVKEVAHKGMTYPIGLL